MTLLLGVDFTSAPSTRKPVTVARGRLKGRVLQVQRIDALPTLAAFEDLLREPGPWLGGFDFPFGLPRGFVADLGLGADAATVAAEVHRRWPTRRQWQAAIDAWNGARTPRGPLPHRPCDGAMPGISSTSPLQTRYVPVAYMYYEGFARLVAAGVHLPALHAGDPQRVALEAYPGLLAHGLIGRRSYKNGDDAPRRAARADLLQALAEGRGRLGLRVQWPVDLAQPLQDDAAGDRLDAVLALVQAAWCSRQPGLGLPAGVHPVEGWIATVPAVSPS